MIFFKVIVVLLAVSWTINNHGYNMLFLFEYSKDKDVGATDEKLVKHSTQLNYADDTSSSHGGHDIYI